MIALPDKLPLIEWKDGRTVPLSEGWLAESLHTSLCQHPRYSALDVDAVVYAISYHLKDRPQGTTLSYLQLESIIRKSLFAFSPGGGFEHVHLTSPRVTIHLNELASRHSIELAFFDALHDKLQEAVDSVVRGIRLEGIRDSVKHLNNARRWKKNCQTLNDEIVLFTRKTIEKTNHPVIDLVIS